MPTSAPKHQGTRTQAPKHTPAVQQRALPLNQAAWRALRLRILIRDDYTCQHCSTPERTVVANEVDHINGNGDDNRGENLQSLCKPCHSRKTAKENGGWGTSKVDHLGLPSDLAPSAIQLTILFGPPAAGKTTYARTLGATWIIDLDDYYAAGMTTYDQVMHARNNDLRRLATMTDGHAVFLVGAPRQADRDFWTRTLKPSRACLVFATRTECERRIRGTRSGAKLERSLRGTESWWRKFESGGCEMVRTDQMGGAL